MLFSKFESGGVAVTTFGLFPLAGRIHGFSWCLLEQLNILKAWRRPYATLSFLVGRRDRPG
jgi:hypothetical protein